MLPYWLTLWLVPEDLIRCHDIPAEIVDPVVSKIPDDCTGRDWTTDTVTLIFAYALALAFEIGVILGVVWIVKRFRTPPADS
jgi:hypothetical protein